MYSGPDRRPNRLPHYDYTASGAYFATICTAGRELLFEDEALKRIVEWSWRCSAGPWYNAHPHDLVVMPDHVHGVVWLPDRDDLHDRVGERRSERQNVSDRGSEYPEGHLGGTGIPSAFPLQRRLPGATRDSLFSVVGAFKSLATRRINDRRGTRGAAVWQRGFYDRIIRDDVELTRVREYIRDNPLKWKDDPNNPVNATPQPGRVAQRSRRT